MLGPRSEETEPVVRKRKTPPPKEPRWWPIQCCPRGSHELSTASLAADSPIDYRDAGSLTTCVALTTRLQADDEHAPPSAHAGVPADREGHNAKELTKLDLIVPKVETDCEAAEAMGRNLSLSREQSN